MMLALLVDAKQKFNIIRNKRIIESKKPRYLRGFKDGASWRIRTSDRSVRSRVLYPAELRMRRFNTLLF